MDYNDLMRTHWPKSLYRAPDTIEFHDRHGKVWHVGSEPPIGYVKKENTNPLNLRGPLEVWDKQDA